MDFEEVYNKYVKDVFAFSFSLCRNRGAAEDITSETFLKALNASANFEGKCSIKVWLCQIAKNTYSDELRKQSKYTELSDQLPCESDFELKLLNKSDALTVHKFLHQLDEPYKEVFSLRTFSELSFAEIGGIFGKSENWARVTFHRAKLKLREVWSDDG